MVPCKEALRIPADVTLNPPILCLALPAVWFEEQLGQPRSPRWLHWGSFLTAGHLNGATGPSAWPAGGYFRKDADELYAVHRPDNLRLSFVERMRPVFVLLQCPRRWMRQKTQYQSGCFGLCSCLRGSKDTQPTNVNGVLSCSLILSLSKFAKTGRFRGSRFSHQQMSLAYISGNNSS